MSFLECSIYSHILGREVSANIIMPHASKQFEDSCGLGRVPVLYLLHGLTENHTAWCRKSSVERYVSGKRLAVVMPDGGRGLYTDTKAGTGWFEFLTKELPSAVCSMLNVSDKREDTFIAGLSMGGYGAFKAALSRPELYSCAASFSGSLDIRTVFDMGADMPETSAVFGNSIDSVCDLYSLARSCNDVPALYQSCGTRDFLYGDNIKFRDFIKTIADDYTFDEDDYDHCWEFWDMQIKKTIRWLELHNGGITVK